MTDAEMLSLKEAHVEEVAEYLGGSRNFWSALGRDNRIPNNIGMAVDVGGNGRISSVYIPERVVAFKHGWDMCLQAIPTYMLIQEIQRRGVRA